MLTFSQFLTEADIASVTDIKRLMQAFPMRPLDAPRYGIQFILPSGKPITLDPSNNEVHARSVYELAKAHGANFQLIDVLEAGIVRAASEATFMCASAITDAQARTIVDRALMCKRGVHVSIADPQHARERVDANEGIGPIDLDDRDYKSWDMDDAKPGPIRAWVNSHF